jgi:ketosteroid isomerase-like protein
MMPQGATLALRAVAVSANGPLAVERGEWTMTAPGEGGAAIEEHGKYLIQWHKVDGVWRMAVDTWNADAAPPPPPADR